MLFEERLFLFLWKSVTFYQESSQWELRHNRSPGISPGKYRGGCSRLFLYYAYTTGTNLCLFVPTTGRSSLIRLFVKTSVWKQVLILHLPLIKTDNFECSHLRGISLNITNAITTKYCKRGAFLRVHNHFVSPTCRRLLYCCGLYTAKFSNRLLIFVCLPKTEVCGKNCRSHVQSVPWSPGYTITKLEITVFREQKRSTFVYCCQNVRWNKLSLFQGTSSIRVFVEMLIPFYKTTQRHIPGDNRYYMHRRVELQFNYIISDHVHYFHFGPYTFNINNKHELRNLRYS
jgi:hypothetical protein